MLVSASVLVQKEPLIRSQIFDQRTMAFDAWFLYNL